MSWQLLLFLNVIIGGLITVAQRSLVKNKKENTYATAILFSFLTGILFFAIGIVRGFNFTQFESLWIVIVLTGVVYALANIAVFKAFQEEEGSMVATALASNSIWVALFSVILLNEKITFELVLGIVFVILGIFIINRDEKGFKLSKGLTYGILAGFFLGLGFTLDVYIIGENRDIFTYLPIAFLIPGILQLLVKPSSVNYIATQLKSLDRLVRNLFLALLYVGVALTALAAYQTGQDASVISPIMQLSTITSVVFAIILLNERNRIPQKIIGSIFAVVGVIIFV